MSHKRSDIIQKVKADDYVNRTITQALTESPELPWDKISIHENVLDALKVDLDLSDDALFDELSQYYNQSQRQH